MGTSLMKKAKAAVSLPGEKPPDLVRAEADYASLRRVVEDESGSPTLRYLRQRVEALKARTKRGGS